jgi:SAM-dependent methyltransferase
MIALSSAESIASKCLHGLDIISVQLAQTRHRINLVNEWGIGPGDRILEIGCGQGDCTAVLASAVGPEGHVDAIDPASLDYGSPWTLGQAQAHLSHSDLGSRISWHQVSPLKFLESVEESKAYDFAVLAHCTWYFQSQHVLLDILCALRNKARRVCIAEYALAASEPAAVPHILAALTTATLEAHKSTSSANIQTVQSPAAIAAISEEAGWRLISAALIVPEEGLLDGRWEVNTVKQEAFLEEIDESMSEERVRVLLRSMRDSVISSLLGLSDAAKVRTMDVWVAQFE